jgi:hypothetical protein
LRNDYAKFYSRSHDAVIRVYVEAGDVIKTHEQASEFQRVVKRLASVQPYSGYFLHGAQNRLQNAI